jgi:hypothetical protein
MSVGAQTKASGTPAAGEADGGGQGVNRGNAAGMLFGRLSLLPALLVMGWLIAGLPLLLLGWFTPLVMLLVSVPIMALLVYLGFRLLPGRWQGGQPAGKPDLGAAPWWSLIGVIVVAVAFGVDQMVYHSQFVIITRDPGSYVQFAAWISGHGSLPIGQNNAAFGGVTSALSFASPAFYQVGLSIVPQFMAGLPMVLAAGFWMGGPAAAVAMAPILGACAVLTFGGLVARLVGPRWAPLAALALALALPMQFTSRSTYSETLAAILFLGGLCLIIDCLGADGAGARIMAALGGLALGLTIVVRLDGASDILPVIPYCGFLFVCRRRQALPMTAGFLLGAGYGVIDGTVLTWPYLQTNRTSVYPLALILASLIVLTVITTVVLRMRARRGKRLPQIRWRWLPNAGAAVAVLVIFAFFIRPYVDIVRAQSTASFQSSIAAAQLALGQPIDPARLYYELSLRWVFWYIGVPAVIFGAVGAAILIRRCLRGGVPSWTLPLLVFSWSIVSTLYRPAITPDQPWASRRLVPAVLPGFILLAVWAVSWFSGWLRERQVGKVARGAVLACCALALVLPPTITTFGLGVRTGGPVGIRLTAHGLGTKTTYAGEISAVDRLCAALPKDASVVFFNPGPSKIGSQLVEDVRGMCGLPAAIFVTGLPGDVQHVVAGIYRAGRQPVLLASYPEQLTPFGGTPRHVANLHTTADGGVLITAPVTTRPFSVSVWMTEPPQ